MTKQRMKKMVREGFGGAEKESSGRGRRDKTEMVRNVMEESRETRRIIAER
jgi:hypothetical protein